MRAGVHERASRRLLTSVAAAGLLLATPPLVAHDPIPGKVTWERDIAPIVEARCVSCHSPGGRGPMSLATYEEARPWARAIREEVLARRMPKWHAARGYGDFENDPSLSSFEIALIAAWVDGGAPLTRAARAGATAPVRSQGGHAAGTLERRSVALASPAGRRIRIPCRSQPLPRGRLTSVTPVLVPGGSLRLTLAHTGDRRDPLLWVKNFDPEFPDTYRLRQPVVLDPGTRLVVEGTADDRCRLALTIHTGGPVR